MTVRTRLLLVTTLGLTLTMALWGWLHLRALREVLQRRQLDTLYEVAQTAGEYFQYFPTRQGLAALDRALEDLIEQNPNLVRIDIFTPLPQGFQNVVGVSRVSYDWSESDLTSAFRSGTPRSLSIRTEAGPALALLLHCRLQGPICRHEDDRKVRSALADGPEQGQAVRAGHSDVRNDQVDPLQLRRRDRLDGRIGGDRIAGPFEGLLKKLTGDGVVV
jgi:hypothetical protein